MFSKPGNIYTRIKCFSNEDIFHNADLDRAALLQYIRTNILSKDAWEDGELTEIIHYLKTHHNKKLQGGVTHVDEEGPPAKKFKPNVGDGKISFRVSCKCSGICGRKVSSQVCHCVYYILMVDSNVAF